MKMAVRAFAILLLVGTIAIWAGMGGTLGWTKTKIPVKHVDAVTGIEYVEYKSGLEPGVEFLALGIGSAVVIFAATLFVRITPKS